MASSKLNELMLNIPQSIITRMCEGCCDKDECDDFCKIGGESLNCFKEEFYEATPEQDSIISKEEGEWWYDFDSNGGFDELIGSTISLDDHEFNIDGVKINVTIMNWDSDEEPEYSSQEVWAFRGDKSTEEN